MSKKKKNLQLRGAVVAEGVRIEMNDVTAFAVRNENLDISVRVRRESRFGRRLVGRIPLFRGVVRLFGSIIRFFAGIAESADLQPQPFSRCSTFTRKLAAVFHTQPQTLAALGSAFLLPFLLALPAIGLPMLLEYLLMLPAVLPRFAINTVCCMFRIGGTLLSIYAICRLRVFNRLCMYRGAVGKVINAYEAYGTNITHEEVVLSPRLTDRSDGAFLIVVLILSMIAFSCVRIDSLPMRLAYRLVVILAAAAVSNEFILPLERTKPESLGSKLRIPLVGFQHLFTLEPHTQMIEVALCAFHAACENSRPKASRSEFT